MKDPAEYNVRAVERALQILDCFDDSHPERGLTEISQLVGLHKATTHRIVTTLVNFGYLDRIADGQKYRLGLRLARLGFNVLSRMDLRREAELYLHELTQTLDETCDLSVYYQSQVFYIDVVRASHALTITASVGQHLPPHCTASGKVFLAHLTACELDEVLKLPLKPYTAHTITSPAILRKQLVEIHERGYAVDREEMEQGVGAVSAPVFDHKGAVVAAISIPTMASRLTDNRIAEIAAELKETAQQISLHIGWR